VLKVHHLMLAFNACGFFVLQASKAMLVFLFKFNQKI